GSIEIIPTLVMHNKNHIEGYRQIPYTPLELAGREIYIREGCYNCHSQMVRPFVSELMRYGSYSKIGESIYDHPFQWGSKRTGPDLHRVGSKYPNLWHFQHLQNPRSTSVGSNMPNYGWLVTDKTDFESLESKIKVMIKLGVPYPERTMDQIRLEASSQGQLISDDLKKSGIEVASDREIVALISYLQQLGKSEKIGPDGQPVTQP
ncbi:MAG: cytochrome-c oxidase, cbb3-type subunit II, partial [Verrucomicrobiota bacterium]